jgi:hypothetical protein
VATLLNPPTTRRLFAPLHLWHLTSLDAPTVAVTWAWAFTWAAGVRLPLWAAAALALIVWTIYIADRLLDARASFRNPGNHTLRDRHHFHWRHRRTLLPLAALAAAAAATLVYLQLPARSLRPDSLVAAATLLWLTSVHTRRQPESEPNNPRIKEIRYEIIVGFLFTLGCALPVSSQLGAGHSLTQFLKLPLVPLAAYAALAALNLHAISQWESHPNRRIQLPAALLALAALTLALISPPRQAALLAAAALAAILLLLLDRSRHRLTPLTLRAAADLVLLTPVLLTPLLLTPATFLK